MAPATIVLSFFSLVLSFYRTAVCHAMPELFDATRGLAPAMVIRSAPGHSLVAGARDLRRRSIVLPDSVSNPECAHACAPIEFALSQSTCVHDNDCVCGVITALSLQQCWQCAISSVRPALSSSSTSSGSARPSSTSTKHSGKRHVTASIQPSSLAPPTEPSAEETAVKAAALSALHDYTFACSAAGVPVTQTLELDGVAVLPLSADSAPSPSTGALAASVTLDTTSSISSPTGQSSSIPLPASKPYGWLGPDVDSGAMGLKTHACGSLLTPAILTLLILVYRL